MKIKNLILMLIICSISFFVSGCIKIDTEINIDKKGHVVVSDKVLIDKQLLALSNMSSEHFYQQQIKFLNGNPDVQTSQIDEGDYTGTKFVSKFKNLNNIFLLAKYFNPNIFDKNDYKFVKISKNIYNTNYKLDWNANFRELKDENGKRMFTPDTADYISSKLTINIPTKAIKTNATSVINDGLTHVWNFYVKNNYSIQLEFNIINYINVVLTIIGLIFLIIGYIFKQSKLSFVAQKYIFGFSGLLFTYFVIAQIFGNIQYLSFNIYDIGIIIIFLCLSILSFYLAFTKENITENHIEKENAQEIVQTSSESNTKICKYCGGEVSATAKKCKHCGEWLINEKDSKKENKIAQKKINPEIQKTVNIILRTVLVILLITAVVLGINKSGLSDFVQNKVAELHMNEIEKIIKTANETKQGYEDVGQENTIYKLMEKDYNQISSFKDKQTGANTYAFRVQTDVKIFNNDTNFFEYELGRIIINPKDIQKSKCTYNFRASLDNNPVKWVECSDKSFIDSIPKIAELKNKSYQQYKNNEYRKLINLFSECNSEGFYNSKCDTLPNNSSELIDGWYSGHHEFLEKLRSTTL